VRLVSVSIVDRCLAFSCRLPYKRRACENSHILKHEKTGGFSMADFDQELDASGLNCPLPILRAKKTLAGMEAGQILHIIATDPGSVKDFDAFSKQTGNELLESKEEGGKFHFMIKKA
jgi:tRNA 2-thiouridine synthesizing protein A